MIKTFNYIIILLVSAACQNLTQKDDNSPIIFDLTNPSEFDVLNLSDLNVKEIDYIPLETNDSSLFNKIRKIIVVDSDIYIHDYQGKFLRFGNDGSLKNCFSRQGRGPKEYSNSRDFTIDPNSHDIYVLSGNDKKIYSYTNQGKFLNCFSTPNGTFSIMFTKGTILCHCPYATGDTDSYLILADKKGNALKKFPQYKYKVELNSRFGYINEIIWFRFNDKLYIKDIHSDTIFLYNNKKFIPQYVLNHGGKTITPEARSQFNTEEKFIELGAKYSIEIDVWRFGDYIISVFMYNNKLFIYAGEMNGDIEYSADFKKGIRNDIDGGPNLKFSTIYYYDDNTMLTWVDAYHLSTHVDSDEFKNSTPKYPEKKKELEKLANSLDENDNPVLMLVKLKE